MHHIRAVEKTGNQFAKYREQLKALLERESPSNRNLKLTSSGNVRLPAPVGRHELARMQLVHGSNYFPVHAPKYHDICSAEEKQHLQVLQINKQGLTLYQGSHWEGFDYGGGMTRMDQSRLHKKLGKVVTTWSLRTIAQWRVFEHHFSWKYIDPASGEKGGMKTYTIESAEPASIGKTIEAYVGALMEDMGMDPAGTFTPQVENFVGGKVEGKNSGLQRKTSVSSARSFGRASPTGSTSSVGSGSPVRRRSSFKVDSPLRSDAVPKSFTSSSGLGSGGKGGGGGGGGGRSGPARRRQSLSKMKMVDGISGSGSGGSTTAGVDFDICVISGLVGRRAGGFLGYNKKFQKKFYVIYKTSQGHYLAEYKDAKCACLPQNPREKWKWPKAWIDLSTTLRVYSPSIVDNKAGEYSMDVITPSSNWTFQFDTENELGKWVRRISKGIQADALIVPDRWDECYANVFRRLSERTAYGERKTKKIGEAKISLKVLQIDFNFTSSKNSKMSFWYWEIMSWRTFRSESSGRVKMALRCFQNGVVQEFEIETFQQELMEIIDSKLTMYTTKLAAGINALKGANDNNKASGKKPKGPAPKGTAPQKKGPPPKGPAPKGPPASKRGKGRPKGPSSSTSPSSSGLKTLKANGSQAQALAAMGGCGKKFTPKKGKAKGGGSVVRGKAARRRPSMGTIL